jgi:hypothetical protein
MNRREFLFASGVLSLRPLLRTGSAETALGRLVSVEAGGLWVRRLPGGKPKQLISGSHIHLPRFSPSGEWIAYRDGETLSVIRADGSMHTQLSAGTGTWLPVDDVLAVCTNKGLALFTAGRWGAAKLIEVVRGFPAFSPAGTQLVYPDSVEKGKGPGGESMREGRICRMILTHGGRGGREPDVLASKYLTGFLPYAWTRDGNSVIYWEDPDFSASFIADGLKLFRIGALGGSPRDLGVTVLVRNDMLALSPFGNELVVTAGFGRDTWSDKRIAVIDLESAAVRYLTDKTTSAICPLWSPNGKRIAYAAAPNAVGIGGGDQAKACLQKRRLWIADASGINRPKQITNDDHYRDEEPMWSRDGTHILFCRMDRSDVRTLWLMGRDGENPIQVSGPFSVDKDWFGYYGYIDWRQTFDWFRDPS